MSTAIIIVFCSLLLISYVFDLTASKTKVPSVISLLLLGWGARQLAEFFEFRPPYFSSVLPVFGTIGLILIVLEGALELELNRSKVKLIKNSLLGASITIIATALLFAFILSYFGYSFRASLINAIPLCIISSAIAIPSARDLLPANREFVIYESSLSDILGVLFFNFITLNDNFSPASFGHFGLQIVIIIVVSFFATIVLSYLLSRIEHSTKHVPIILLVILIYAISKVYHLPGLLFIVMFGIFIGNFDELKHFSWTRRFRPAELNREVKKFKEITVEGAFLVRSLFFVLFGYYIDTSDLINPQTLIWSVSIVAIILIIRILQLKISGLPLRPLLFMAPRGLITILLFLSISPTQQISLIDSSLVTQVIIISAFVMMTGLMFSNKQTK